MELPVQLQRLFWDTDGQAIDPQKHRAFVLDRVLEYGGIDAVRWAEHYYGLNQLAEYFQERGQRVLSAKTRAYWRAVFTITQTPCTSTSSRPTNNPLWPY